MGYVCLLATDNVRKLGYVSLTVKIASGGLLYLKVVNFYLTMHIINII